MDPSCVAIASVIAPTQCFEDSTTARCGSRDEPRLARYVSDTSERAQILHDVHCEAKRVDIPPELVLAVMDVESRPTVAVSAGAVGLMQVMPFWPQQLGMTNDQLVRIPDNVRMGTTILGYYLRKERELPARAPALQRQPRPPNLFRQIDRLVRAGATTTSADRGSRRAEVPGHRAERLSRSRRSPRR
jgi:hypothetical protein